jgi:hypothetical protein
MTSKSRAALAALLASWLVTAPVLATEPGKVTPVDPGAVTVPDLAFTPVPRDERSYDEYFLFHKPGITTAAALSDIQECRAFSRGLQPMAKLTHFVPLGGEAYDADNRIANQNAQLMYGLTGVIILAIVNDGLASDNEHGNTRRCMGFKGYQRYGTSRSIWKQISKDGDGAMITRLALIASANQTPPGRVLEP